MSGKIAGQVVTWKSYILRNFGAGRIDGNEDLLPPNFTYIECNGIEVEVPGQTVFGALNYPANDLQIGTWFETEPREDESTNFPDPQYLDPRTIDDCFMWLKASNHEYDINDTFLWIDSTINGNDWAQAGEDAQPFYDQYTPSLNFLPSLDYNNDQYVFSLNPHNFTGVEAITFYVAFSPNIVPEGDAIYYSQLSSVNKIRYFQSGSFIETGYLSGSGGEGGNLETLWTGSTSLQLDKAYVGSAVYRVNSETGNYFSGKMKLNGRNLIGEYKQFNEGYGPGIIGTAVAAIGQGVRIAEIVLYKREVTSDEDKSVTSYLVGKYNAQ